MERKYSNQGRKIQKICLNIKDNTIKIIKPDLDSITMQFDQIYSPIYQQNEIFQNIEESIDRFLHGENQTFFA